MVVALVGDDDGRKVVAAVDDAVADVDDLRAVDARLALQIVEEVRERGRVVVHALDRLLLRLAALPVRGEREREARGGRGDVRDRRGEEELDRVGGGGVG